MTMILLLPFLNIIIIIVRIYIYYNYYH